MVLAATMCPTKSKVTIIPTRMCAGPNSATSPRFVQMAASNQVDVQPLISHRFPIDEAAGAYALVTGKTSEPYLAILLTYPGQPDLSPRVQLAPTVASPAVAVASTLCQSVNLGVLGAGNFALATLLPALKGLPHLQRVGIASSGGLSARSAADRFGFDFCATDEAEILQSPQVNTVAILTRHDLHARQVIAALQARKHVFVEKPLCLTEIELDQITVAHKDSASELMLMVGFNRRFAPMIVRLKQELTAISEPLLVQCRVNAGYLPPDHWLHDPAIGGGRLIGEGCHFIDLLIHLIGSDVQRVTTRALPDAGRYRQDNLSITLEFENGSIGVLTYLANGDKRFGKERIEAFGGGLSAAMDDYRSLTVQSGRGSLSEKARLRQDKGHQAEWEAIIAHLTGDSPAPIPTAAVFHSMQAALAAQRSLQTGESAVLTPMNLHA